MIWTAVVLGFLGSFHCLGMCGPIAMAISAKDAAPFLQNKIIYNLGRTLTYSFLGAVVGMLGYSLSLVGFQQGISIGMGIFILLMAFFYKKSESIITGSGFFGAVYRLKSSLSHFLKRGGSFAFFMSGILNGFLPCGMVYIALIASLALQSPLDGAIYMFSFGLGTIPMLIGVMISGKLLPLTMRQKFTKALPYMAMLIGILFIVRGMGLGGHILSPDLQAFGQEGPKEGIEVCE